MPYHKLLVGDKCYLSPCTAKDAEQWALWFNDLEVTLPLGDEAYTLQPEDKLREELGQIVRGQEPIFSIVDRETDTLIGRGLLFAVNPVDRSAMLGIVIGEKVFWGKGYGQDAVRLLLDYGFTLLNLNSIMLGTFSYNERALACYRKVGFKEIGRRRQARIIGDRKYDCILMDMLAEEFRSLYASRVPGAAESGA